MIYKMGSVLLFLLSSIIIINWVLCENSNNTSMTDFKLPNGYSTVPEYCLISVPEMIPVYVALLVLISLFLTVCACSIKCTRSGGENSVNMSDYAHSTESL